MGVIENTLQNVPLRNRLAAFALAPLAGALTLHLISFLMNPPYNLLGLFASVLGAPFTAMFVYYFSFFLVLPPYLFLVLIGAYGPKSIVTVGTVAGGLVGWIVLSSVSFSQLPASAFAWRGAVAGLVSGFVFHRIHSTLPPPIEASKGRKLFFAVVGSGIGILFISGGLYSLFYPKYEANIWQSLGFIVAGVFFVYGPLRALRLP